FKEMQRSGRTYGFRDLFYFPVLQRLKHYSHIWFVEYDVDFAGDWDRFFARTIDRRADFLGTTILPQAESKDWGHWHYFVAPQVRGHCDPSSQSSGSHNQCSPTMLKQLEPDSGKAIAKRCSQR